jgi:glyoxylase-like metal-dependent hydrolase (beta-lactamase superfamily II)
MATPTFSQITPHIYKLELPYIGGLIRVGVWLVRGETGWTLVDAGVPGSEKRVMEQVLKQTGGALPELLVLTHGHADHAGAAFDMRRQWKLRVAAGRAEIPYLIGPKHYSRVPGPIPYRIFQMSRTSMVGLNVQLPLDDGMHVGPFDVFHTPGHAPGHVALLHREDEAVICGDVFVSRGGKAGNPRGMFTYDMALNRKSQQRLAQLDFKHLLVSHGAPILNEGCSRAREHVNGR